MTFVRFNYLYRDGANFKNWGNVVFANLGELSLAGIEARLLDAFLPDKHFIASQIQISDVFLFIVDKPTAYDHCFHEFDSVEACDESPNDTFERSIEQFLMDVENQAYLGWKAFDILEYL
jgi:hypothetical protein